jgi:hypothetical protein
VPGYYGLLVGILAQAGGEPDHGKAGSLAGQGAAGELEGLVHDVRVEGREEGADGIDAVGLGAAPGWEWAGEARASMRRTEELVQDLGSGSLDIGERRSEEKG